MTMLVKPYLWEKGGLTLMLLRHFSQRHSLKICKAHSPIPPSVCPPVLQFSLIRGTHGRTNSKCQVECSSPVVVQIQWPYLKWTSTTKPPTGGVVSPLVLASSTQWTHHQASHSEGTKSLEKDTLPGKHAHYFGQFAIFTLKLFLDHSRVLWSAGCLIGIRAFLSSYGWQETSGSRGWGLSPLVSGALSLSVAVSRQPFPSSPPSLVFFLSSGSKYQNRSSTPNSAGK